jgi:hypothetical protein
MFGITGSSQQEDLVLEASGGVLPTFFPRFVLARTPSSAAPTGTEIVQINGVDTAAASTETHNTASLIR